MWLSATAATGWFSGYVRMESSKLARGEAEAVPSSLWDSASLLGRGLKPVSARVLTDYYDLGNTVIGVGQYGKVFKGRCKETGRSVAIKEIKLCKNVKNAAKKLQSVRREARVHKRASGNDHICDLIDHFEHASAHYLVMECCESDLFEGLAKEKHLNEENAKKVVRDCLRALRHLHEQGIAHRDVKPENILVTRAKAGEDDIYKLTDFGLSSTAGKNPFTSKVGTSYYIAPQVLSKQPYTSQCDLWSLGVVTFTILTGYPPFDGDTNEEIFKKILASDWRFHGPKWDNISQEAKEFIALLLAPDEEGRPTAAEALTHRWLAKGSLATERSETSETLASSGLSACAEAVWVDIQSQAIKAVEAKKLPPTPSPAPTFEDPRRLTTVVEAVWAEIQSHAIASVVATSKPAPRARDHPSKIAGKLFHSYWLGYSRLIRHVAP